ADSGPYTGTLKIDLQPPATDGSIAVAATEMWWNTLRPTATDDCAIFPNGAISCLERPYSLSPMDLTVFPLLATNYFNGLTLGKSSWPTSFQLTKGISLWDCATMSDQGIVPGTSLRLVVGTGTITPHGNHYTEEAVQVTTRIAYDPVARLPVLVNQEMLHN